MKPEMIFDIILVLIGLYLAFFKSYFQEKGKNIATSEDIEELTHKVEAVKQNFIEKNASLKAKLDLLTNLQISHKNDERNSLIEFHKEIKSWIGLLTESSPSLVDEYDNQEINTKIHQYDITFRKVLSAEALLELYVDDEELGKLIFNMKINILKHLAPHPTKYLMELKHNNFNFEQHQKMPIDTIENIAKNNERHKELLDKRSAIYEDYRGKMMDGYKEVIEHDKKYRSYMKEYISKVLAE